MSENHNYPKILVTAARGKTAYPTAVQLLQEGYSVRAMVHREDQTAKALSSFGAEIMVGDLHDIVSVRKAVDGVKRAYFCHPPIPNCLYASTIFAEAAREERLEAVVNMSQWLSADDYPSRATREHWLAERVLEQADIGVSHVNPGWFADNYMLALEPIAQLGVMPMPLGDGKNPPPSNEDIARVIVGILKNPAPHIGKTYRPTGPRSLSPIEIADTFAKVLGRPVKYQDVSFKMFAKAAKHMGFSDFFISQIRFYIDAYRNNEFDKGGPTNAVLEISGRPPEAFESIVHRYARTSKVTKPGFSTKAKALTNFMRILLTPVPSTTTLNLFNRALA